MRTHQVGQDRSSLARLRERVASDAYKPVYAVQSLVSEWIGDAKIVNRPPFISVTQIAEMEEMLEPGDILLERRNWYLSNAFLPGFCRTRPYTSGREEDLARLEILDEPAVRARLSEWRKTDAHGWPKTVIEAVSEGVIFNSLEHSMQADYVAVLRPRCPSNRLRKRSYARSVTRESLTTSSSISSAPTSWSARKWSTDPTRVCSTFPW